VVRVLSTGLATYADASVVCGPAIRDPEKKTNVTNPRLLVEVTSDSTEDYDRGEKLEHYKRTPSLQAILVVSHREPRIELWSRASDSKPWNRSEARSGNVAIPVLGLALDVDAIWRAAAGL
jgi:Uma2 family endonuclease